MDLNKICSDSDSSSSSDEEENELELRAEKLEKDLNTNKYIYDAHLELTDLYRRLGDLKSLRAAYKRFHECYPLSPNIWVIWLNDECRIANTPAEIKHVYELCEDAIKDYASVSVWLKYCQFFSEHNDLPTTRKLFDRALNAVGLHTNEASLIWNMLRELEYSNLAKQKPNTDEWKEQVIRVNDIFKRQLSVPLLDMKNTYKEWQKWLDDLPDKTIIDLKPVEWAYQKALKTLDICEPFEKCLNTTDEQELYKIYTEYIKEMSEPSMIISLYERAICKLCLNTNLWLEYCTYTMNLGEISHSVSNRALRNCPWSEDLWIIQLRILEQQQCPENEIRECFESGMSSISPPGLELWLTYLEYVNRSKKPKEFLLKLFQQAVQQVGDGDPTNKLLRYEARLLARKDDMKTVRHVWNNILHNPQCKTSASAWLEYIALERQYGEPNQLRQLFQRALSAVTDWPQCISEEWLMYERECGTLENVMKCIKTCKTLLQEKEINNINTTPSNTKRKFSNSITENEPETKKFKKHIEKPRVVNVAVDNKKSVFISNLSSNVDETTLKNSFPNATNINLVRDRKGVSKCYAYVELNDETEVEAAVLRDREPINGRPMFISYCKQERTEREKVFKYSQKLENNKLFIRGLPYKYTKEDLEKLFEPYKATEVRLVSYKSGQSKGLAYVDFETDEDADKALKEIDQTKIGEHIISVAISAPPLKQSKMPFIPTRHARSQLQMPLIPRSVQVKKETNNGGTTPATTSKSNEDFRKMLLN